MFVILTLTPKRSLGNPNQRIEASFKLRSEIGRAYVLAANGARGKFVPTLHAGYLRGPFLVAAEITRSAKRLRLFWPKNKPITLGI